MKFQNRIVVVTGAAKGIGAAAADYFVSEGARVVGLDVDRPAETAAGGPDVEYMECDVSSAADVDRVFADIEATHGRVAVLVNNAGIQVYGTVTETSEEDWDRILDVNVKGPFLCARAALSQMTAAGTGVIVNVSSVQGIMSEARVAAYTTSKSALLGLTRSIAIDYAPEIRCVAVCPGTVDTPLLRWAAEVSGDPNALMADVRAMHLAGRIARPEEVARFIGYLASDDAGFITGHAYRIDGGLGVQVGGSRR